MVGVGACECLSSLSVDENKAKEEEVGHPSLDSWWVCGEEHIVLEPWNVSADDHDTEGHSYTIEGGAVGVQSRVLEDGDPTSLCEPDVPELAHDQGDVPCSVCLHTFTEVNIHVLALLYWEPCCRASQGNACVRHRFAEELDTIKCTVPRKKRTGMVDK